MVCEVAAARRGSGHARAPATAMPTSAFLSAGASFTPSPVMATVCPRLFSSSTICGHACTIQGRLSGPHEQPSPPAHALLLCFSSATLCDVCTRRPATPHMISQSPQQAGNGVLWFCSSTISRACTFK